MKVYYWEDPANLGWDIVAQAENETAARSIAKEKISLEVLSAEAVQIQIALDLRPTGIFHYPCALCIFTETDPLHSRISRGELAELSKQMRERASFGASASLARLLETWADLLEGKPDVGWAARNREDLRCEAERLG